MIATVAWMLTPSVDAASAWPATMAQQWRPPATRGIVEMSSNNAAPRRKESADDEVVRSGCAQSKLYYGGSGSERQEAQESRRGDKRLGADRIAQDDSEAEAPLLRGGTQSARLYEVRAPHVDETVVTIKRERRGNKDDERTAFSLADKLRTNSIKVRVCTARGLGELVLVDLRGLRPASQAPQALHLSRPNRPGSVPRRRVGPAYHRGTDPA